jgi:hypothetical protein
MANIVVSQDAIDYISEKKMKRPNLIVYRDVSGVILGYTTKGLTFQPKVKLAGIEPNELFVVKDNSYGFPIWVERGLLPSLAKSNSVLITLKKGFRKGLELKFGSELAGST